MPIPVPTRLARIALGTSPLGVDTIAGTPGEEAALRTAAALLTEDDALIDTSNAYAGGRSEQVLGAALDRLGPAMRPAAEARLVTKVDRDPETGRFDGDRVRRSVEESLRRLGVDRIPLLHLHDPYTVTTAEAFGPSGAVAALIALRDEGVAGTIGIAAGPVPLLRRYIDSGAFDAVLCHNRFTLVDASARPLFAAAKDRGMTVFNAAPFGAGLLARGAQPGVGYGYRPASAELLAWTAGLERLCAAFAVPLAAVALQFSLRSPLIDRTVVGVSSPQRLAELRALCACPIPEELWHAVRDLDPAPSPIDDTPYGDDE